MVYEYKNIICIAVCVELYITQTYITLVKLRLLAY